MSSTINLSPEGWEVLYHNLMTLDRNYLQDAIACILAQKAIDTAYYMNNLPCVYERGVSEEAALQAERMEHYQLVDLAYHEIQGHTLCTDDGECAYIDEEGIYQVKLGE